jgi:hypothetical protein
VHNKKSEWIKKEERGTAVSSNVMILDGRCMEIKAKGDKGFQSQAITTYDLNKKAFRQWHFDSYGGATDVLGQWDEEKKTMTWKGGYDPSLGFTINMTHKLIDNDHHEWTMRVTDRDGKILLDQHGKATRKKN